MKADYICEVSDDLFFMRQKIGGACGAIAILHAIANTSFESDSAIAEFITSMDGMSAEEIGEKLCQAEALRQIAASCAQKGEDSPPERGKRYCNIYLLV